MSKKIKLRSKVIVSDPCYSIPTWCQKIVHNVLPGEYKPFVKKVNCEGWGRRVTMLSVIHTDYLDKKLNWQPEGHSGIIGVDSGQAGIFNLAKYRRDDVTVPMGDGDVEFFKNFPKEDEDGGDWYTKICSHTLGKKQWGSYEDGVVSSSGIGDGGYDLYVARSNDKVIGILIDFLLEEDNKVDMNWHNKKKVIA